MTIKEFFSGRKTVTPSPTEHKTEISYVDTHYLVWNKDGGKPRHYQYPQTFTWDEAKEVILVWNEPCPSFTHVNTTAIRGLDGVSVDVHTEITFTHSLTEELMKCETFLAAQDIKRNYVAVRDSAINCWFHDAELPETVRKIAEEVKYTYGDAVVGNLLTDRIEMFINSKASSQIGSSKITVLGRPRVTVYLCDRDARTRGIIEQRKYENNKRIAELENDLEIRKIALEMERRTATDRRDLAETNGRIASTKALQELHTLIDVESDARAVKKNELLENSHSAKESALAHTRMHELLMKLVERLPEAIEIRKDADGKETKTATNLNIVDLFKQVTLLIDGRGGLTADELEKKITAAYDRGFVAGKNAERARDKESACQIEPQFTASRGADMGKTHYRTM